MKTITGLHSLNGKYIEFYFDENQIKKQTVFDKKSTIDFLLDPKYPVWLVRHSFGKDMGEEDYSNIDVEGYLSDLRGKTLGLHQKSGVIRDLFYHGLKVPVKPEEYSHAVGPIHAGIIEPGHFRFVVEGEVIKYLSIRLGFQFRNLYSLFKNQKMERAMALSETISGDTSVGYALSFAQNFESSLNLNLNPSVKLFRSILVELERISAHIADFAGISGDMGFYPLNGVCLTDRGAALGLMESWTGHRFGKGAIRVGGIRLNQSLPAKQRKDAFFQLKNIYYKNIKPQFLRAVGNSTVKERLQGLGEISISDVDTYGFVGMVARMAGKAMDLRVSDDAYPNWIPISTKENIHNLGGDVWARFYLRYLEIEQSLAWIEARLDDLDWDYLFSKEQIQNTNFPNSKYKSIPGEYFSAVEAWRGPLLTHLSINDSGEIEDSYIRDPSVLNWFALEKAVRGVLLSDFPLNNKSFNLSYVGFDL